jgi:Tol biopolymer transport system component
VPVGFGKDVPSFLRSCLLSTCCLALAGPAHAAQPGRDGRIAFESFAEQTDCGDQKGCGSVSDIALVKPSGGGLRTLTSCDLETRTGCATGPAWSPDGTRIAFAGKGGIWIMDADGSDPRPIDGATGTSPVWSRDGRKIAYSHYPGGIAIVKANGGGVRHLTKSGRDGPPTWSSAGAIAFVRNRPDAASDVMTMTASGTRLRRIVRGCACFRPDYSPDGRWVAFEDRGQIWMVKRDGAARRQITRTGGEDPAWSPSSTRIAYVRDDDIYVARRDGTGVRRIAHAAADRTYFSAPSWQPLQR